MMKMHILKYSFLFKVFLVILVFSNCNRKAGDTDEGIEPNSLVYPTNLADITKDAIPKECQFKGKFLKAKSWIDTTGQNVLIISYSGVVKGSNEFNQNTQSSEYYAVQYIFIKNQYEKLWELSDFEKDCPFDLWIGTMPGGVFVTDLDSNGKTETTLAYKKGCRSDVSPSQLRIAMFEGVVKMGLEGSMLLTPADSAKFLASFEPDLSKIEIKNAKDPDNFLLEMGRYKNAKDFEKKPEKFLEFGRNKWLFFISRDDFKQL